MNKDYKKMNKHHNPDVKVKHKSTASKVKKTSTKNKEKVDKTTVKDAAKVVKDNVKSKHPVEKKSTKKVTPKKEYHTEKKQPVKNNKKVTKSNSKKEHTVKETKKVAPNNERIIDLHKVNKDIHLKIKVECDKVLNNSKGCIAYSYENKGPLFNAYIVDSDTKQHSKKPHLHYTNDRRIPIKHRTNKECFKGTNEDLGHLEPHFNMSTSITDFKHTYLMSNVAPRPAHITRLISKEWEKFEKEKAQEGTIAVITGVNYYKNDHLNNNPECGKLTKDFYKVVFAKDHKGEYSSVALFAAYRKNEKVIHHTEPDEIYDFLSRRGIHIVK